MDELAVMKQPLNPMGSSIPKSTLQKISKREMIEAVEDKKMKLKQSDTKIPAKDVDVLRLIDTSDLYGLINDGIIEYNVCNMVQEFTNDVVGNVNALTMIEGINEVTVVSKLRKAKPGVVHEINHGNTKLTNTKFESNNTLGTHIVEEEE